MAVFVLQMAWKLGCDYGDEDEGCAEGVEESRVHAVRVVGLWRVGSVGAGRPGDCSTSEWCKDRAEVAGC